MDWMPSLPSCAVCSADWREPRNSRPVATAMDVSRQGLDDLAIRACTGCGLGFTSPVPTPETAGELYASRGSANFDPEGGRFVGWVKDRLASAFVGRLAEGRAVRRVLDYSTGNGRFALAAARRIDGAAIVATDVLPTPPAALQGSDRVRYVPAAAFAGDADLAGFDLILVRHVLEHVYDPEAELAFLRDRLAPGGAIFIEVPNLTCPWAPAAGRYFPGYYAPYHVHHFERSSLARLLEGVGLAGEVRPAHMPLVGNVLSRRWALDETLPVKLAGIGLYPLQVLVERIAGRGSVLRVLAERAAARP